MNKIVQNIFAITVVMELVYVALFVLTIKIPDFRFWPPPKARSWQFFFSWLIAGLVMVNFLFLGLLDFDSFVLPSLKHRLPFTMVVLVVGISIGGWAFATFGLKNTIGVEDKLVTDGPYRFTRNPQYIGDSLNIIGYMLLTNSWMVWIIGILGVTLNLLAPYTEEPWLAKKYGERYLSYKQKVPRFIGKVQREMGGPTPHKPCRLS